MRPATARRDAAPPPELTRDKAGEIERHAFAILADGRWTSRRPRAVCERRPRQAAVWAQPVRAWPPRGAGACGPALAYFSSRSGDFAPVGGSSTMHTWRQRSTWSRTVGAVRARLEDAAPSAPLPSDLWRPLAATPLPYAGLATTLAMEYDYAPRIEGHLPPTLQGTLYRNGPGRFDRGGLRKRMLLDGDGMLQVYQFHQGQVRFRTRFVRTAKYVAEEAAGRLLYRTWSTLAPGGMWANLGLHLANQAEVTVIRRHETLYAFGGPHPYALDPET